MRGTIAVWNLLDTFCKASEQRVNHDKSFFFIKGCPQQLRNSIKNTLHVQNESMSDRYLGMPPDVGQSRMDTFRFLWDQVWEKVRGWMEKLLSADGKEDLVKEVARPLPVYSMACFRLPRGLCENITSIIRQFWRGSKQGRRKPCWLASDVITNQNT